MGLTNAAVPAVLDILGIVREAQTKFPVGNIRDTVKVGVDAQSGAVRKNVQYSTGFNLPPGKYLVSVTATGYKIDGAHFTVAQDGSIHDANGAAVTSVTVAASEPGDAPQDRVPGFIDAPAGMVVQE